ncbi:hydantoinase/oxoprolinase family protein [Microbacterium rhizophilus]|uniref:hydantoinase/oxoprolinase family protein n=1 Tax=Microbacterium rhizophilus TaxID=3138934 RepID=UPI0031F05D30
MNYRLGIDVGGTFTDLFLVDENGAGEIFKTPSTPHAPAKGFFNGITEIANAKGLSVEDFLGRVTHIMHGTTITTNATLTGNGARTALITTAGFRDVQLMRRGVKSGNQYDYTKPAPAPLIPRQDIFEVTERIDRSGAVLTPLDEAGVREAARAIGAAEPAFEAVAINLMWSFLNDAHEARVAEIVEEELPDVYISRSSEVVPQIRVYERGSTVALNAYVGPILSRYLTDLTARLEQIGYSGRLFIVQSNGGVMPPQLMMRYAVNTLLSGPAGGPEAGLQHARLHGLDQLITVDMGGTSFDVAMIEGGKAITTNEAEIDGYRVALPVLDIHTIGAGGGSIAKVRGGLLEVGPQSAGSEPGPACYGRGGENPTTTDADLLLGYLDPIGFAGGRFPLDLGAATTAMRERVADPLGLTVPQAAQGVYDIVNASMADAVRAITVQRGHDPREFAIVAAGGAGPLHAGPIARELEAPLVLIPRESSVFCASGMAVSDIRHDYVRSFPRPLTADTVGEANDVVRGLLDAASETLLSEDVAADRHRFTVSVDVRYPGQFNEVETTSPTTELTVDGLANAFHDRHELLFGYAVRGSGVEIMNIRVHASGVGTKPTPAEHPYAGAEPSAEAFVGTRQAWFDGAEHTTPIYAGLKLTHGNQVHGPAIVEQPTTTIVVPVGYVLGCDARDNYVMHRADITLDEAIALVGSHQLELV